jgi:hypothetical protein
MINSDAEPIIKTAVFECNANGNPSPIIKWFKNNVELLESNKKISLTNDKSQLRINDINANDAATYKCMASSIFGSTSVSAKLNFGKSRDGNQNNYQIIYEKTNGTYDLSDFDYDYYDYNSKKPTEAPIYRLSFKVKPVDTISIEDSTVRLYCSSTNPYYDHVAWLRNGEPIRNTYRFNINSQDYLEIKHATADDEGFYVCSLSNRWSDAKVYSQAKLTVNVPVKFLKMPINKEAIEGNSIEFECKVNGKPIPKIEWQFNGHSLKNYSNSHYEFYDDNQTLVINNLAINNDSGIYSCVASNNVNTLTASASLMIKPAIEPFFRHIQQNISVFEGHPISFECFAEGDPHPQVLWYKNGKRIVTDKRVFFDSYGYLKINQVRVSDSGEYLCRAVNKAGFVQHSFEFSVKDIYGEVISNLVIENAIDSATADVNREHDNTLKRLQNRHQPKTSSELMALLRFPKDETLRLVLSEEIYERALELIFRYANNITFNITQNAGNL